MMQTPFLQEELLELRNKNLYRKIRTFIPVDSVHVNWQGRPLILFCANDYLGLSCDERVKEAVHQAVDRYGAGAGAARLISGTSELHTSLEDRLAEFKQKESALVFSAGYLANLGVLTAIAGKKDLILMDKLCHASLIDAAKLSQATLRVFPHKQYQKCEEILSGAHEFRRKILVTDTVFSMDGDLADLPELIKLKHKYQCLLVTDDAHGTGVLGLRGSGAAEDGGLANQIDIITGTLSKAFGCLGGFAAASAEMVEYLINFSRPFIFATALPPMLCAAALKGLDILETDPAVRHRLWQNIQKIHQGLVDLGFETGPITSPIFPILFGDEKKALNVSDALLERGFLIPAVRYPTVPKGKARLRLTVSAAHTGKDIQQLLEALKKVKNNE